MLISGLCMNMIHPVWKVEVQDWSLIMMLVLAFTIHFGTTIAFWMFIKSLEYLEAKETTLLGTVEPLTACNLAEFTIWFVASRRDDTYFSNGCLFVISEEIMIVSLK